MEKHTDLFQATKGQKFAMRVFLCMMAIFWLLPVYSLIMNSLKGGGIDNYIHVVTNPVNDVPFYLYFVNSFSVAFGSSSLVVIIGTLAGFAFSKIHFTGKNIFFSGIMMCMAVSTPIVYVPFFYILKTLHLYNTYWAVILPEVTMTLPFAVLMMRNYFDSFPSELLESAYIDGASMWQVFTRIYFPLAKPALINLGVLQVMWSFQDFLIPLMFLTKKTLFTATVAINVFKGVYGLTGRNLGYYNAALVIISIPAIITFAFAQKYIVSGITSGALKE
jgi:raffinose/stachyose/melibiose transport system permease protein